jgi:hypothetical protein
MMKPIVTAFCRQIHYRDAVPDSIGHAHDDGNMANFKKQLEVQHE